MANKILYMCQEVTPYLPETESSTLCRSLVQAMQERSCPAMVASMSDATSCTR